ncbi:MAG: S-layer homology domain-containing protein [Eubacteriales bacterium]|nr:S-layer homology domain-containing protein [Eubacteriales bacterium]
MKDFTEVQNPPWVPSMGSSILEIKIQEGVTNIGSYAFQGCSILETVSIPESVVSVKGNSFPKTDFTVNYIANSIDHEFMGWYEDANCTGDEIKLADFSENATYYAKWVSKTKEPSNEGNTSNTDEGNTNDNKQTAEDQNNQGDNTTTGGNDEEDKNDTPTDKDEPQPGNSTTQKQQYDTSNLKFEDATVTYDGKTHSIQATGEPEGVTVTYDGNGQFAAGTYTVTATVIGDDLHEAIPNMEAKLIIEKANQNIFFGYETLKVLTTDKPFSNPLGGVKEQATVTYTSSDEKVATIDKNGEVTVVGEGTAEITATTAETADYKQTAVSYTLTVAETLDETDEEEDNSLLTTEYPNGVKVSVPKEQGKVKSAVVTVPEKVNRAVVTIPVENLTYGTVAMNAKTGEILKLCVPVSDGLAVEVDSTVSLILFDNSKVFTDISGHWGEKYINFASAHDMFAGTSDTTFTPDIPMTRGMMMTVIARFNGVDVSGGSVWYERGMNWAKAMGVSDGTNPTGNITREQLVSMLYRYSGSPDTTKSLSNFSDAKKVSSWAVDAMKWAVENNIIHGMGNGTLSPSGNATRVQTATIMTQYCSYLLGV